MGRVWVDQVEGATLFLIPAKKDWKIAFFAVWLTGWSFAGRLVLPAWRSLIHPSTADWFNALWGIGWVLGIGFVSGAILWGLGGVERIRLTYVEALITRSVFGVVFCRKPIPTGDIRNLRFTLPAMNGRKQRESRINFEDSRETVSFGFGLSDGEALAVIERMLAIYPFSKRDRALEYIDPS